MARDRAGRRALRRDAAGGEKHPALCDRRGAPSGAQASTRCFPSFSRIGEPHRRDGALRADLDRRRDHRVRAAPRADAREEPPRTPSAAIASLGTPTAAQRRVFCENFYACSAALQYPSLRVFIDGRADPYPLARVALVHLGDTGRAVVAGRILKTYGVDAVLASRGSRSRDGAARRRPVGSPPLKTAASWYFAMSDARRANVAAAIVILLAGALSTRLGLSRPDFPGARRAGPFRLRRSRSTARDD